MYVESVEGTCYVGGLDEFRAERTRVTDYYHGTRQPFADTIVSGGINVAKGSGEFGVGFYTQDRATDAWQWAIGRWKKQKDNPAVVVVTVDPAELAPLCVKGPLDHKRSNKLRQKAKRIGKSLYIANVDVIIGTIVDRPKKNQEKFESSSSESLLNSHAVGRSLDPGK